MLQRKEIRYMLEQSLIKDFINEISQISEEQIFPTTYNWTLYFNNVEHEVPFEVSVKGRKYSNQPFSGFLKSDEEWIFEIKEDYISKDSRLRKKKREILTLERILNELSRITQIRTNPVTLPLKPYVADSYRRRHFIVDEHFRFTVDDDLTYYLFEDDLEGKEIGNEDYARIEIKILPEKINSTKFRKVISLLKDLGAEETISKKDMAYNLLSSYLRKKLREGVPYSDTEIEAKLLLHRDDQHVFHKIKRDFYNGLVEGFEILNDFPYTLEGGKLHTYIITQENDFLRISKKEKAKTLTLKENAEIIDDPFQLGCIIKRREIKKPFELNTDLLELPSKTIYRKRKYFLVKNKENSRTYCILIDRCTYNTHELFQMEIEGLLLSTSKNEEKDVVRDVSYLTHYLTRKYLILKPTTLTKLDWLKEL